MEATTPSLSQANRGADLVYDAYNFDMGGGD